MRNGASVLPLVQSAGTSEVLFDAHAPQGGQTSIQTSVSSIKSESTDAELAPAPSQTANVSRSPINYAPPDWAKDDYVHPNLPNPVNALRGSSGNHPWYVVKVSRRPGIYSSW